MNAPARPRYLDFNALVQAANLATVALMGYVFFQFDSLPPNQYMNAGTAALGLLLAAQTQAMLWVERRRRDPFVLLLAVWMIFYYQLRIYTLAMLPYSVVFDRFAYDASDSNYALVFIVFANLCIWAGLYAVRFRGNLHVDATGVRATSPGSVVVLLVATIAFAYLRGGFWTADNIPRALNFLTGFLTPDLVILMALVYLLLFRRSVSRPFVLAIGGLIVLDMVVHTLWGSRSAIMGFAQIALVVALAVRGVIRVRRRTVALGVLMLPALAVVLVAMFTISTYNRIALAGATQFDVGQALSLASEARESVADSPLVDVLLPPIAGRAGYFDFAAEIIANHDRYAPVINFAAYGRSVIDNILTPGFDVFDQPMTANGLRFVYNDVGPPSKVMVGTYYHSDQLCLYGEAYALFGYGALPLLLLGAFAIKRFFVNLRHRNPFFLGAARAITLLLFIRVLDSFGADWVLSALLPYLLGLFMFTYLFTIRRASPATPPVAGPAQP